MRQLSIPALAGQSSAEPARPEFAAQAVAELVEPPESWAVGYSFDPIPSAIRHDPRLKPIDHLVLAILISFAIWRRDSCWTTVRIIAARIAAIRPGRSGKPTVCERTVQRSIDRLKRAGYLRHERVAKPDPDQPDNWTGWRFYFNFAPLHPPAQVPPREVTKAGGEVTKAAEPAESPPREVTMESGDSVVTQGRIELREPEGTTSGTGCTAVALEEPEEPPAVAGPEPEPATPPSAGWEVLDPKALDRGREWEAREIIRKCDDRSWLITPEGDLRLNPIFLGTDREPPAEFHQQQFREYRPEIMALKYPPPPPPRPGVRGPAAPEVPGPVQADVLARIKRLARPETTKAEVAETARMIASATGPHEDEGLTLASAMKWCGQTRRGEMGEGCLRNAFEAACGPTVTFRGRYFTKLMKIAEASIPPATPKSGGSRPGRVRSSRG